MTPNFTRDGLTWLCYGLLAYYAFVQAALGPVMPFLRDELALSYTLGGLHPSAFAAGMIIAGLRADRAAKRWGRRAALWGGALGMGLGLLLFIAGRQIWATLPAVLLMGLAGTLLLVTVQSALADRHGRWSATALTEANVAASLSATLAPLAVGTLAARGAGWRAGLLLAVALLLLLIVVGRAVAPPPPPPPDPEPAGTARLPRRFWRLWLVLLLAVAAEWCVVLWSADYLETIGGLVRSDAARWLSAFFLAALIGRVVGSRLTRRVPGEPLLLLAMLIAAVGVALLLFPPLPGLRVAGLAVAGVGIGNLFPLALSIAVGLAPRHRDEASARVALAAGIAILLAPLLLGGLADRVGLEVAFRGTVLPLLAIAFLLALLDRRELTGRPAGPPIMEGS